VTAEQYTSGDFLVAALGVLALLAIAAGFLWLHRDKNAGVQASASPLAPVETSEPPTAPSAVSGTAGLDVAPDGTTGSVPVPLRSMRPGSRLARWSLQAAREEAARDQS